MGCFKQGGPEMLSCLREIRILLVALTSNRVEKSKGYDVPRYRIKLVGYR